MSMKETMCLIDLWSLFWSVWYSRGEDAATVTAVVLAEVRKLWKQHTYTAVCCSSKPSWREPLLSELGSPAKPKPQAGLDCLASVADVLGQPGRTGYRMPVLRHDELDAPDVVASAVQSVASYYDRKHDLIGAPQIVVVSENIMLRRLARETPAPALVVQRLDGEMLTEQLVAEQSGLSRQQWSEYLAYQQLKGIGAAKARELVSATVSRRDGSTYTPGFAELASRLAQGLDLSHLPHSQELVEEGFRSGLLPKALRVSGLKDDARVDVRALLQPKPRRSSGERPSQPEAETEPPPPEPADEVPEPEPSSVRPRRYDAPLPEPARAQTVAPAAPPIRQGRFTLQTAARSSSYARIALCGPAGSGKTFTALQIARGLTDSHERIVLLDTENGSAAKYADGRWGQIVMPAFDLQTYIDAIGFAQQHADVLIIDSASHAWAGPGGALELADNEKKKVRNGMDAWRTVTPLHNRFVDSMVRCRCHLIVTMRTKTEWVFEQDQRGKQVVRKVGTKPIQRDGLEYEFDVVCDLTHDHELLVGKTRLQELDGAVIARPTAELGARIRGWLAA